MIKSMLASGSTGSSQGADLMIQAMLGAAPSGPIRLPPIAIAPAAEQTTESPAQLADSMIQMFGNLSSASAKPSSTSTTAAVPAGSNKQKPLPSLADLPMLTAIVAPPPTPAISTTPTANPTAPIAGASNTTVSNAPQLPAPAAPVMPVKGEIAFTAILTPMKNLAPTGTADVAPPVIAPIVTTASTASGSSALAIATTATAAAPLQPAAAQTLPSQAAVPVAGKDSNGAQAGGNMQQGGDSPSQQDGSTGTQAKFVAADAKGKTGNFKQDDNPVASTVVDRAPVADATFTAFPEQARPAVTVPSDTPVPAPTPFHSTAEALRTADSTLPATPQVRTGVAQEISIRIAQPDSSTIDLRVVERSGQLHVDVRTTDPAMQSSLRQDLGTLTNSLNRAGYHSETFTPSSTLGRTNSSAQMSNQEDSQDQSQKRGGSGDFTGDRRQQQQQKRSGLWLEELETIQ